MQLLGSKFGSAVLLKFLTRIDKQSMLIFQEKWVIFRSSLPSMKIVVYWYTYYREQSYRELLQQIIFDFCTMEMLMSKAKYYSEPAFLNHNLLPQPEFKSGFFNLKPEFKVGPEKYLLRKALLCISLLLSGIACVQKISLKDIVIKMVIVKYLSIISRMKATVITDGQYKRRFQIPFLGQWSIGLIWRFKILRVHAGFGFKVKDWRSWLMLIFLSFFFF